MPRRTTCPTCGKRAAPRRENRSFPFCSDRCRLVDLAKWLGEEYRIPGRRLGEGAPDERAAQDGEAGPEDT